MAYDVIVVGLGAMGSAAAAEAAGRGARVLGLDRYAPPHALGSSHGRSRIIREAYFEHPLYVPLVQRAYALWERLEERTGARLLVRTGGLMVGPPDGELVAGALRSAETHGLAHEVLTADEVRRRVPGFRPPDDSVAVLEPRAGLLFPERAIAAQLGLAGSAGADLRLGEPVVSWTADGDVVEVRTAGGRYAAARLILAAGAWLGGLVPELALPLEIERAVLAWFGPSVPTPLYAPERFPIFLHELSPGRVWYGFPDTGHGVKVAAHHHGEAVSRPEALRREVKPAEVAPLGDLVRAYLPAAAGPCTETAACMYTNTPDSHFLIDAHPAHPAVLVASPCSGHGFKFSPAIGEILADLALTGTTAFDLTPFRLDRFRGSGPD